MGRLVVFLVERDNGREAGQVGRWLWGRIEVYSCDGLLGLVGIQCYNSLYNTYD